MNINQLNIALCTALGVDPARISSLTLTVRGGHAPQLIVGRRVFDGDKAVELLTALNLTASPVTMDTPPAAEAGMAAGQGASCASCSQEAGGGEISGADVVRTDPLGKFSCAGNPGGGVSPEALGGAV